MGFPSDGYGEQSKYFDDELLFDGTYQIITVTLHSSSRDETNPEDTEILRPGLLLAKSVTYEGYYEPLNTADGYLNGDSPTQYMTDILVLGRKMFMTKDFIMGLKRERTVPAEHKIVPAYISGIFFSNKLYYNNSISTFVTDAQWQECQRIQRVPAGKTVYKETETVVRALLGRRVEALVTPDDLI
jgi:hypothetical protein